MNRQKNIGRQESQNYYDMKEYNERNGFLTIVIIIAFYMLKSKWLMLMIMLMLNVLREK